MCLLFRKGPATSREYRCPQKTPFEKSVVTETGIKTVGKKCSTGYESNVRRISKFLESKIRHFILCSICRKYISKRNVKNRGTRQTYYFVICVNFSTVKYSTRDLRICLTRAGRRGGASYLRSQSPRNHFITEVRAGKKSIHSSSYFFSKCICDKY